MSTQDQIDRIKQNVANTYAVLSALGADMPEEQTSDNLATTAGSAKAVLYSAQTLTEAQKAQARENIGVTADGDTVIPPLKIYAKKGTASYKQEIIEGGATKTYTAAELHELVSKRIVVIETYADRNTSAGRGLHQYFETSFASDGTVNQVAFRGVYVNNLYKLVPSYVSVDEFGSIFVSDAEWSGGSVETDQFLTKLGVPADAKKVGDRLTALSEQIANSGGGTSELLNEHGFLKKEVLPPGYGYVEVNSETVYIYASGLTVDENGFYDYSRRIPALRVGETYTVSYNGANYTCTAVGGSVIGETDDDIALGNYGLVLGEEGTGEPFVLLVSGCRLYLSSGISAAIIPLDGEELSSDILISGLTITHYPSHPDYTGTSPLVVTCRHVDGFENRLETDTDFSIILTAIKAGRIVVCIADGRVFGLKAYDDISIEFDCIRISDNIASVNISNATLIITNGTGYASYTANTYTVPFTE